MSAPRRAERRYRDAVKITILGGGPAGLYLSILMRKARPDCEVMVVERYRRGDTPAWGVVFSDSVLGRLRRADPESYAEVAGCVVRWDAIDVHFRGAVLRSDGHDFGGLSRRWLLNILADRAERLGVRILFQREHCGLADELVRGADLVVAADGSDSLVRTELEHVFKPTLEEGTTKYLRLETQKRFDTLTVFIRDDERGRFTAYAYSFSTGASAFIVETDAESWSRAELDRMSAAEGAAFCEQLFAEELAGQGLMNAPSPTGFSHDIPHRGRFYHVFTDATGWPKPRVFTSVFHNETLVGTTWIHFDDKHGSPELAALVLAAMQDSHKSMIRQLRDGTLDEGIVVSIGAHPRASNRPQEKPLSKTASWQSFRTVSCERWWHGNVVLIGDAAHTTHAPFGSGSTLALEDAIVLADALRRHDDVPAALQAYEDARRLEIAAIQPTARIRQS